MADGAEAVTDGMTSGDRRSDDIVRGHGRSYGPSYGRYAHPAIADPSDLLFYAALALLPVDGLTWGVQMPYWSPFSPILFAAYALCNARLLPRLLACPWRSRASDAAASGKTDGLMSDGVMSDVSADNGGVAGRTRVHDAAHARALPVRFPALVPFLLLLAAVSVFGWATVGVNVTYALRTMLAMACAACTLLAFAVAWSVKRLPMRAAVTVLVCAYACAFLFGVFTWLIQPGRVAMPKVSAMLMGWFLRQYFVSRPQFLFAEPSYIGMHLFGVLLPLFWLTRDRRLLAVVVTFAAGALAMGSGVRIALDSVCALALCLASVCPWRRVWRDRRLLGAMCGGVLLVCAAGVAAVWSQPRLRALFHEGLLAGDDSMSARIFRSVAPLTAGMHDWPHLLFGFGAGNLGEAMRRGYAATLAWYQGAGGRMSAEIAELRDPLGPTGNLAGNAFTMDAYASFITEFGLVLFVAAVALILRHVTRHHAWSSRTVCWLLLLAYLYAQFEAYAFYALPLFLWATADPRMSGMLHSGGYARGYSRDYSIADSSEDMREE